MAHNCVRNSHQLTAGKVVLAAFTHSSAMQNPRPPILTHASSPSESITIASLTLSPPAGSSRAILFESSSGVTLDRSWFHAGGVDVGTGPGSDVKVGDSTGVDAEDPCVDFVDFWGRARAIRASNSAL